MLRTIKVSEKQMKKYKKNLHKFCGTLFGTKLAFSYDKMYKIEFSNFHRCAEYKNELLRRI